MTLLEQHTLPELCRKPSQRRNELLPWLSLERIKPHNVVHAMPHIDWHEASNEESDSGEEAEAAAAGAPPGLLAAALFLLEDRTLASCSASPDQRKSGPGSKAVQDWDAFVEAMIGVRRTKAAASLRLLAMCDAVPSPSARMEFHSQVCLVRCTQGMSAQNHDAMRCTVMLLKQCSVHCLGPLLCSTDTSFAHRLSN